MDCKPDFILISQEVATQEQDRRDLKWQLVNDLVNSIEDLSEKKSKTADLIGSCSTE